MEKASTGFLHGTVAWYFLNKQVGVPIPTALAPWRRVWKPDLLSHGYLDLLRGYNFSINRSAFQSRQLFLIEKLRRLNPVNRIYTTTGMRMPVTGFM